MFVYDATIYRVWFGTQIYWTPLHIAHDFTSQFSVTQRYYRARPLLCNIFHASSSRGSPSTGFPNCFSASATTATLLYTINICPSSARLHTLDTSHSRLTNSNSWELLLETYQYGLCRKHTLLLQCPLVSKDTHLLAKLLLSNGYHIFACLVVGLQLGQCATISLTKSMGFRDNNG
jgi:hypothetical protein